MKRSLFIIGLLTALAVSCTVEELVDPNAGKIKPGEDVFYATIEGQDTKTYAKEDLSVVWNKDDRITIFNRNSAGDEYAFQGENGSSEGPFINVAEISEEEESLTNIIAVFPHDASTTINPADESISMNLPAKQDYVFRSFGRGAGAMVSVSQNRNLSFKNLGGVFAFRFYGENVSVASVILRGNNNEPLAGPCTVTMPVNGKPTVLMDAENASRSVKLYCKDAVKLDSDPNKYTEFWFAIPPTTFSGGFTVTVMTDDGRKFERTNRSSITIDRNMVKWMAPLRVDPKISETVDINSLSTIFGKKMETAQTDDKSYTAEKKDRTFTFTIPTWTASYGLKLNAEFVGNALTADGVAITANDKIDVSKDVTLAACKGDYEMRYTLKVRNTGLPVVRITTNGFTMKDIEDDENHVNWRPSDTELTDPNNYGAEIRIEYADGSPALFKVTTDEETGAVLEIEPKKKVDTQVKGRGNATWTYKKRPYALKFGSKRQVFDMPPSKRWILLANWKDRTLMRNDAAFWLSQQISDVIKSPSFPYSVHGQFVELEFNGVHRGNYYFCEQIKIEENRLNLTKVEDEDIPNIVSGPFLMEIDNNYDETYKFLSGFYSKGQSEASKGLKYMFKFPDENLPDAAFNYMKKYIAEDMEPLIKKIPQRNYGYREYLDMDSAIWFMFVNELTGNGDFFNTTTSQSYKWYGPHSTYFYKDMDVKKEAEDGTTTTTRSKLFMGPVWDFDYLTFYDESGTPSRSNKWVGIAESDYYYYYLTQDPEFRSRIYELWTAYKPLIKDAMGTYIENMKKKLELSEPINTAMWGYNGTDQNQNGDNGDNFATAVSKMKSAFTTKLNFMDGKIIENATASNYRN